jgi:hypothetical protein
LQRAKNRLHEVAIYIIKLILYINMSDENLAFQRIKRI